MANLYGVANSPGQPGQVTLIGGADVNCPAGSETNILTSPPLIAPSNGYFYAWASGIITLVCGTTPPTAITVGIRVGAGADTMQFGINTSFLTASDFFMVPIGLFTPESTIPWQGAGSTVSIGITPVTGLCVARVQGSSVCIGLLRGIDL